MSDDLENRIQALGPPTDDSDPLLSLIADVIALEEEIEQLQQELDAKPVNDIQPPGPPEGWEMESL